ncbi:hypothetical protein P8A11_14340, partial [Staphylococcus aureus]|nr:hypothetical protein [Staphylococcus aureus]
MKINIYKSIYNFQETNTNFLENLESLNDDNYELLNDKELESSPDSCVKCYTMFLPFLLIKIDVF